MRFRMLVAALIFVTPLTSGTARAAKPDKLAASRPPRSASSEEAEKLVEQALLTEAAGQIESRLSLLAQALKHDPNCAAAHWHRGELLIDGKWLTIDAATKQATSEGKIFAYNSRRAAAGDTPNEQLKLAAWCRQHGLKEQLRAHALRALSGNPESAEARQALDLYPVNGRWLTESEIIAQKRHADQDSKTATAWLPRLKAWSRTVKNERTQERIREINDASAIPAMERTLSTKSSNSALLAVAAIANMEGQDAAASLVRHAVLSPWDEVRKAAAEALRPRSLFSYAPLLLAGLEFPTEVEYSAVEQGIGSWSYRCQLFREGPMADTSIESTFRIQRFDDPIVPPLAGNADRGELSEQELGELQIRANADQRSQTGIVRTSAAAEATESAIAQANARTELINSRIATALSVAIGKPITTPAQSGGAKSNAEKPSSVSNTKQPRELWNWWYDYNDIYYTNSRPVSTQQQFNVQVQPVIPVDCFAAGTLVWTCTGPLAIELAKPGDLVLAQHPESGELAYKPVLIATVRPPANLLRIATSEESLVVTKGHPLWVSGKGWRMARELAVGDQLHTTTGTVAITAIEPGPRAEAYSLVVDEFNTYFVGRSQILGHDNNLRRPTDSVVPGLAAQH